MLGWFYKTLFVLSAVLGLSVAGVWAASYRWQVSYQLDIFERWSVDVSCINGVMVMVAGERPVRKYTTYAMCSTVYAEWITPPAEEKFINQFAVDGFREIAAVELIGSAAEPVLAPSSPYSGERFWHDQYTKRSMKAQMPSVVWLVLMALPASVIGFYRWGLYIPAGYCKTCGYNLKGLPEGAACPECGVGAVDA